MLRRFARLQRVSHPLIHAFTHVGRLTKCSSIVPKVFMLIYLLSSYCHYLPIVCMRHVVVKSFEHCECANEQRALPMPLTSPTLSNCGKEDLNAFNMKMTSSECTLEHIGSSSFVFGDTNTTMYESKIELDSSSSIGREGEVGRPLGTLTKRKYKQKWHQRSSPLAKQVWFYVLYVELSLFAIYLFISVRC